MCMKKFKGINELRRIMSFMRPRMLKYSIGVIGNNLSAALGLNIVMAFIYKDMVNSAVNRDITLLVKSIIIALVTLTIASFICTSLTYMYNKCIRYTMTEIRQKTFFHMECLPINQFERRHSGDTLSRMTNDLNNIEYIYADGISGMLYAIIVGVSAAISMFALNWKIALYTIGLGIITFYINTCFANSFRNINDKIQQGYGKMTELISDLFSGIQLIKLFHLEDLILKKYNKSNDNIKDLIVVRTRKYAVLDSINSIIGGLSFIGIVIIGGMMALKKNTDFGTVMAFIKLQGNISFMFFQAGSLITEFQRVLAGASRLFELLDEPIESQIENMHSQSIGSNAIEMRNVVFQYSSEKVVLNNFNISVPINQKVALVGSSGCGKSTIIKILLGFYTVNNGSIEVCGKSINSYTLPELRNLMSYVPQDTYLFDGTIEENIRYGKRNASQQDVIEAAIAANAHEFILNQPEGYNTQIGERGARLSGGQRQRIAIARAFLKNAPILLLDEATSSLDSESENQVQIALESLMRGRTVIVIAHRLSTIENADKIYVVAKGKIVECGKHEELINNGGLYKKLHELQFKNIAV
ncbi:ABC transporter ATP-binding protein [Clostridium sp. TW13]|uniref:ABC transporter ATP-binding protein n=1 Tax=Inconstantimicrobium mannanitabidum TaxID=1604901 RepID=A0ACB5RDM6_9CLOT|nr:ABC transporter ATP-binding protein [Clostridium sp. TW13]